MTAYVAADLAQLEAPNAIEDLDYEAILAGYKARVLALNSNLARALGLEQSLLNIVLQAESWGDLMMRARVNTAVRAVMVAFSRGTDLDHIALTFYGVTRPALVDNPRPYSSNPEDWESDDVFRARAVLSMEARSVAGPEGAYVSRALDVDKAEILDAACYGEEDGARYADGTLVLAPEVLVVVLSRLGDGTPTPDLLDKVRVALNADDVRPVGDKVTVEPAKTVAYRIEGVIQVRNGADPTPLVTAAEKAVKDYAIEYFRISRVIQRLEIAAKLQVANDIKGIKLVQPAQDVDPGSKGAAYCSGVSIGFEYVKDSWR